MNKEMAYLLGALRDGCFTKNESNHIYRVRIYQKNKEWIELLGGIAENLFGKKPTISIDSRDEVWNLMLNSREIYEKLVNVSDYTGSQKTWNIPREVLVSPSEIQKEFIKGFFDSEGGVPHVENGMVEGKNIVVHFTQSNEKCLEELKDMIQSLGIKTGKVCGPYYKKGYSDPFFRVKIHGRKEVAKFAHVIGSLHPEKQRRLLILGKDA